MDRPNLGKRKRKKREGGRQRKKEKWKGKKHVRSTGVWRFMEVIEKKRVAHLDQVCHRQKGLRGLPHLDNAVEGILPNNHFTTVKKRHKQAFFFKIKDKISGFIYQG
jgi:hypothetical protein